MARTRVARKPFTGGHRRLALRLAAAMALVVAVSAGMILSSYSPTLGAAGSLPAIDVCADASILALEDASVSADDVEPLQLTFIEHLLGAAAECPMIPSISVATYGGNASYAEPVDAANLSDQRARLAATLSSRWTNPVAALSAVGLPQDRALNILLTDWRFAETGPWQFGPPEDADRYMRQLVGLAVEYRFVIIGLGGPATGQDQRFAPLWQSLESVGLGAYIAGDDVGLFDRGPDVARPAPTASPSQPGRFVIPVQGVANDSVSVVKTMTASMSLTDWLGFAAVAALAAVALSSWTFSRRAAERREPTMVLQLKSSDDEQLVPVPYNGQTTLGDIHVDAREGRVVIRKGDATKTIESGETVTLAGVLVRLPHPGDPLGTPWIENDEKEGTLMGNPDELTWNARRPIHG